MKILIVLSLVIAASNVAARNGTDPSCTHSSYGKEYVFAFMDMPYYDRKRQATDPTLSIRIAVKYSADVYITISSTAPASKASAPHTTRYYVYKTKVVSFNSSVINRYQNSTSGGSIKITSDNPIAVLAVYRMKDNRNVITTPILPVNTLSTSYTIPSYKPNSDSDSRTQILIVALNDSTSVRFEGYDTGNIVQTLRQNEIYVYERRLDLSGTSITSNYPVAIFSSVAAGNHDYFSTTYTYTRSLSMHVPPNGRNGVHFIVPSSPDRGYYEIRIYAPEQGALVEIHSSSDRTKHAHVYNKIFYGYTTKSSSTLEIISDNPIMVVQIVLNRDHKAMFMTAIPSVSQYLTSYVTHTPVAMSPNFVFIIRAEEAGGLLLDGKPVLHNPDQVASMTPLGHYTTHTIPVSSRGVVSHVGQEPFGLLLYAWEYTTYNSYEYGYGVGAQFTTAGCAPLTGPVIG